MAKFDIDFNVNKQLFDVWTTTPIPFKSSPIQDLIKKSKDETQYSWSEIDKFLKYDLSKLKEENFGDDIEISIGTVSCKISDFKDGYTRISVSDAISRLTHTFVRILNCFVRAEDKSRIIKYLLTTDNSIILQYRDDIGHYVTKEDFIQLNELISDIIYENRTMSDVLKKYGDLKKEWQLNRFLLQYKETNKWIDKIGCENDDDLEKVVVNLLKIYRLNYTLAENEVHQSIALNTMQTPNTAAYFIQNNLSFEMVATHEMTPEQADVFQEVLTYSATYLAGYLRDCDNLFPTKENLKTWLGYYTKSKTHNSRGREISIPGGMSNVVIKEWGEKIDNIWKNSKLSFDQKIAKLKFSLRQDNDEIMKSFASIYRYKTDYPQIHSNYYPFLLKYERKMGKINKSEAAIMTFYSVACSLPTRGNLFPGWTPWQNGLLSSITDGKTENQELLGDIMLRVMVDTNTYNGQPHDFYEIMTNALTTQVYEGKASVKDYSAFALTCKVLSESCYKYVQTNAIIDIIRQYKDTDIYTRTLEHWLAKQGKKRIPTRWLGFNMSYRQRIHNCEDNNAPISTKLENGIETGVFLDIIYNKPSNLQPDVSSIVNSDDFKVLYNMQNTDDEWITSVSSKFATNPKENPLWKLRNFQLRRAIKLLHGK